MQTNELRSVTKLEEEIAELERLEQEQAGQEEEQEEENEENNVALVEAKQEEKPLSKEEETFKKRYSDLRRHSQKLSDDLKAMSERVKELEKQKTSGLPTAEEAEAWAKANPKAAAIIRALATEQVSHIAPKNEALEEIQAELERTKAEVKIKKVHPDFEEITAENEFHDWAESQPEGIQNLIYDGTAEEVIWAISQYKKEMKLKTSNPQKEAAKAVGKASPSSPETKGKGRFTESMVNKMSLQEYEKNEAAIAEAMSNGTFVYDLSGAAR